MLTGAGGHPVERLQIRTVRAGATGDRPHVARWFYAQQCRKTITWQPRREMRVLLPRSLVQIWRNVGDRYQAGLTAEAAQQRLGQKC